MKRHLVTSWKHFLDGAMNEAKWIKCFLTEIGAYSVHPNS